MEIRFGVDLDFWSLGTLSHDRRSGTIEVTNSDAARFLELCGKTCEAFPLVAVDGSFRAHVRVNRTEPSMLAGVVSADFEVVDGIERS